MRIAAGEQASGNPVISAADAFGLTVGLESTGIYNSGSIRSFDPQAAGNARIDGLYFDQQGGLSDRIVASSTVRVGTGEIGFAFPAPTGIVDYQLRHAEDDEATGTVIVEAGPYDGKAFSIDGSVPVAPRLQVQGGASVARPSSGNLGYSADSVDVGAVPSWTPNDRLTVRVLVDWQNTTSIRTPPQFFSGGNFLPAPVRPGFLGQYWALQEAKAENLGATFDARLSTHWSLAGGIFLYASGSALLPAHAVAYLGYTQGFEDSGAVPGGATNRGAILPTTRSWQVEGGIRYPLTSALSLTAGTFQVTKPYFNLDADNVDRMLGWQRAAGLEMSLAGQVLPGLYVNAGALIGHAQVIGANLGAQGIGTAAVGQPRDMTQVNAVYALPALPSLSLDIGLKQMSAVPATVDDGLEVRGWSVVDLGNRWQFKLHGAPATLRVQVRNLFDVNPWSIGLTPGLTQFAPRTLVAYLTVAI